MIPPLRWAWAFGFLLGGMLTCSAEATRLQDPTAVHLCRVSEVRVLAADSLDVQDVCNGVQDALSFFSTRGLQTNIPLAIEIVPEIPEEAGPDAVGRFVEKHKKILLLSYGEFRQHKTCFNIPISRELYRSLAKLYNV